MNQTPLPGHAEQPEEIVCPSCGRFVGALPKCPHCGARINVRMSVRAFRYASILLATVGLGLLYLMATHKDIPIIEIGTIKPTMNFAYIRVAGKVTEETRVNEEAGVVRSVRFTVSDGTGDMPVTAFRAKGQELVDLGLIPHIGDEVEVTGSLSISAERKALWLQAPAQLKIVRAEILAAKLGDITEESVGSAVIIEATIKDIRPPRQGSRRPWLISVEDDTGKKDLNIWQDTYNALTDKVGFAPGQRIRARVAVGSFRNKLQLQLTGPDALEFLDEAAAAEIVEDAPKGVAKKKATAKKTAPRKPRPPVPIASITEEQSGKYVKVAGEVVSVTPPTEERAPTIVVLAEGENQVPIVYWDGVADKLGDQAPVVGRQWQVTGQVNIYSNEVQLKVNRSTTARLLPGSK